MTQWVITQCNVLTSSTSGFHIGWRQVVFLTSASKFSLEPNGVIDVRPKDNRASPNVKSQIHVALFWDVSVSFAGRRRPSRYHVIVTRQSDVKTLNSTLHSTWVIQVIFRLVTCSCFWRQRQNLTLNPMVELLTSAQNTTARNSIWKPLKRGWV